MSRKYTKIDQYKQQILSMRSVKEMCRFFEVSRSGYYKYLKQLEHPAKDFELAEKIRAKQEIYRRTYGYRRMKLWLDSEGIAKNPKTVLRIMHKYGFLSKIRHRLKWQKMGDDKYRYDNLLNRKFNADHPNLKWVTDISYISSCDEVCKNRKSPGVAAPQRPRGPIHLTCIF